MTRRLRRTLIPATLAASTLILSAPTASADHQESLPLPTAYTLGRGHSTACSGQITGSLQTPHDRPGIALVTLSWTPFFTSHCSITAYVNFWNTATHKGGTMAAHLTNESSGLGTPRGTWTQQISIPIGSGNAGLTVTTEAFNTAYVNPNLVMTRFTVP
ncbi:hypothetical protein [Rhodococcus phenolicus]|uniref:hypothetical protein n=1 Tax=Rhodococcus phenolicus TaxID=263849 RepID=UPI000830E942|nr:hypothetical protein [Rhodococcus phenolicus]